MNAVIGIDIGSSAIKGVLLDLDEMSVLRSEHSTLNSRIPQSTPGHFEEDPNLIRVQVFDMLRSIAEFAREKAITIEAIAFTGQMHGGLLVDSHLEPLTNFITWQDKRGDEMESDERSYVEELRSFAPPDGTGVGIHTGFLISTLFWLEKHNKIPSHAAHILGIYDWLTSLLVGKAITDISSAAAWGMFDPITKSWRTEMLDSSEISMTLLPDVAEPGENLGIISHLLADEIGLAHGIRIHASIGDTQAAYLGSECAPNEILLNFGTGSQSMWETSRLEATTGVDIRYLRNGRYLACAPTLAGGEAYLIAANFFREIVKGFSAHEISMPETLGVMDRLALESDANGMTIDPIFRGSKFRPDSVRGAISGVSSETLLPGPFIRALIEGMIEEVAEPYFIRTENKMPAGVVGAGTALRRNAALQAVAEARFGRALRFGRFVEEAAIGAAKLCF
jgi:sugar (pentulose or hexulose) kinase